MEKGFVSSIREWVTEPFTDRQDLPTVLMVVALVLVIFFAWHYFTKEPLT